MHGRRRQRTRLGFEPLGQLGEQGGVDLVGLGQAADGLGESARLAWIDDGDGQAGFSQSGHDEALEPAGGFEDDGLGLEASELLGPLGEGLGGALDLAVLEWGAGAPIAEINLPFADVDTDVEGPLGSGGGRCKLLMVSGHD